MTTTSPTTARMAKTASELGLPLDDVVIIMACNEKFVPYTSVALQSIYENASTERHYDVVVFSNDLAPATMQTLRDQLARPNFNIGFLDAVAALGDVKLPCHGHFARETYYRLLAPELLDRVQKAIYIDSDLVVLSDLAQLFDTDVSGHLLAATLDADTAGQCAAYDEAAYDYLRDDVGLDNPYAYFQAGVLVMNLEEFRRQHPTSEMIEVAAGRHWNWLDQDVLNRLARGSYKRLDMEWNVLMDWQGLRRSHIIAHAPAPIPAAYETARAHPRIVHYAGPDGRPWTYPDCDFGEKFWDYARRSPYLGELERRLEESRTSTQGRIKRIQVFLTFKLLLPVVDFLGTPGSRRRAWFTRMYKRVTGGLL